MTQALLRLPRPLRSDPIYPPGAEPVAVRAGRTGLLVLHGFTGSPWEIRPLCDAARARGWSVAAPVLPGHATDVRALDSVHWQDWLAAGRDALQWLERGCDVVHIAGFSMGALVATLLADGRASAETRLLLLAPAFALQPLPTLAIRAFAAAGFSPLLGKADPRLPDGRRPPCYHAIPLRGAHQLVALIDEVRSVQRRVPGAVAVVHGSRDLTVPMERTKTIAQQVLGPQLQHHVVSGSAHLLLRDAGAAQALKYAMDFLETGRGHNRS